MLHKDWVGANKLKNKDRQPKNIIDMVLFVDSSIVPMCVCLFSSFPWPQEDATDLGNL